MDMDPAERGGVEWVSEFGPVKGSNGPSLSYILTRTQKNFRRAYSCRLSGAALSAQECGMPLSQGRHHGFFSWCDKTSAGGQPIPKIH